MLQRKCYALFAKGHSILAIRQLNQDVRVRFAPSPTGNIHLGSLRTALYNYLFARKHGGKFLLRIEDTDQTRLVSKSVDQFYGLTVDEGPEVGGSYGPYVQSERLGLYQTESDRLIDSGHAYRCFCSEQRLELLRKNAIRSNTIPKYDKKCRSISQKESLQRVANSEPFVVRFKMDRQDIDFKDEVFGPITQTLDESDMIILKSDGYPTYHMANIVDDSAMKISHVIRGMEWLSSTGKHALLYRAFDRPPPKFVHLPLITRDGKRKLSKRDKDSFVDYYSETLGALPIAVLNLMIRNGSGIVDFDPGRLYSLDEMAVSFDEKLIGKRNLQLDEDALRRLSRLAFQRTATAELVGVIRAKIAADVPSSRACLEDDYLVNIIEFLKSNEERFAYLSELTTGQFSWFLNKPTSAEKILTAFDRESTVKCLQELQSIDSWSNDSLKGVASNCAISFPKLLAVLRYALIDNVHVFTIDEQKKYNLHMEENMGLLSFFVVLTLLPAGNAAINKAALKEQAYNLFMHGYRSYMNHAYPADELMPLTCQGRFRGVTPSRGDVDDSLGNFSLTLVDTLDTLVVLGELDEFERAVKLVVDNVRFNSDLIVSVFETNIRVLGGLLSAHLMAELVRSKGPSRLAWYTDRQLLKMAIDIGDRLLPAFNTTSGIPYSRINLRHGMSEYLQRQKDTCTACGGTMLLEMAALSRLSGNPVYEQKARKAMDFLWSQRHRSSDLMGTVLNVHSGDWVRRESGIGAGIDSYYEYCLKSYILLGDHSYLERFNKHYDAVMRYVNKGPLFVDVHMHRPTVATRQFMDALLAFWPGLQVLKGDVKEAIEMHEMLFQVVKKHKFLPEAFTHDFQVHWGEHPLRPEFIESTYFLYRATRDEHYLEVMESIEKYVKVKCGFAAVKDVRVMTHEDRMDSFVLSETFKYLYMIFAEPEDLIFDPDNYVLTTEAHFLPLSMGVSDDSGVSRRVFIHPGDVSDPKKVFISANPVRPNQIPTAPDEANKIRTRTRNVLEELFVIQGQVAKEQCVKPSERLRAWAFSASNADHIRQLREMGIDIQFQEDGRMLLSHTTASGGVVRCAMDMDSSEATFYKDGLNTSTVHLNQMIQLLVLILVIWTAFIASALVLACSSTVLTRNSSSTEPSETKKDL